MLPAGQGVPRLEPLGVDGERGVAPTTGLAARPLRRRDHRHRPGLGVCEGDSLALVLRGEVGELGAGAPLQGAEAFGGQPPVRGARQRQDGLAGVGVLGQRRPPGGTPGDDRAIDRPEVGDLGVRVGGDALGGQADPFDHRTERGHLLADRRVVTFHHDDPRHGLAGYRLALAGFPIQHPAAGLRGGVGGVVLQGDGHDVTTHTEVLLGHPGEAPGEPVKRIEVGLGLPLRGDRRGEGVHEGVHVSAG